MSQNRKISPGFVLPDKFVLVKMASNLSVCISFSNSSLIYPRCEECSAVFLSQTGLKMHMVMIHKKDKKVIFQTPDQTAVDAEEEEDDEEEEDTSR